MTVRVKNKHLARAKTLSFKKSTQRDDFGKLTAARILGIPAVSCISGCPVFSLGIIMSLYLQSTLNEDRLETFVKNTLTYISQSYHVLIKQLRRQLRLKNECSKYLYSQ